MACLQLVYEPGQRLQERITTLGLVPRHRVESRKQVTEFSWFPDVLFFNWMGPECQPTKSAPRQIRLAIERSIVAMSPDQTPQSGTQGEKCGDGTTVARSCTARRRLRLDRRRCTGRRRPSTSQCQPWNNHRLRSLEIPEELHWILHDTVSVAT